MGVPRTPEHFGMEIGLTQGKSLAFVWTIEYDPAQADACSPRRNHLRIFFSVFDMKETAALIQMQFQKLGIPLNPTCRLARQIDAFLDRKGVLPQILEVD